MCLGRNAYAQYDWCRGVLAPAVLLRTVSEAVVHECDVGRRLRRGGVVMHSACWPHRGHVGSWASLHDLHVIACLAQRLVLRVVCGPWLAYEARSQRRSLTHQPLLPSDGDCAQAGMLAAVFWPPALRTPPMGRPSCHPEAPRRRSHRLQQRRHRPRSSHPPPM